MPVEINESPGRQALWQSGAVVAVRVVGPARSLMIPMQIDLGSTDSSVDVAVLTYVGAPVVGTIPVFTPDGQTTEDSLYQASLVVGTTVLNANLPGVKAATSPLIGDAVSGNIRGLIGRDVLQNYQLLYNGQQGSFGLASGASVRSVPNWGVWALVASGAGLTAITLAFAFERKEARDIARIKGGFRHGR